jgi:hypothetical protein
VKKPALASIDKGGYTRKRYSGALRTILGAQDEAAPSSAGVHHAHELLEE